MYERMNIEDWKAKKKNDRDAVMTDQKPTCWGAAGWAAGLPPAMPHWC